jgi:WD40 repeat protein
VSSAEDGTVIIWRHYLNDPIQNWSIVEKLSNLQGSSVTCHSTLATDLGILICASNSKAKLVTWFRSNNEESFSVLEEINTPPAQMAKTINLMNCPTHGSDKTPSVILSLGSVDSRVHLRLYNIHRANGIFGFCHSTPIGLLTGHEDWVTCLSESFYLQHQSPADRLTKLYFASGSQDSKIRIWKIIPSTVALENDAQKHSQTQSQYQDSDEIEDEEEEAEDDEGEGESSKSAVGVVSEENTGEARCAFMASQGSNLVFTDNAPSTELILYSVTLETLLVGHEDWITSLHWMAPNTSIQQSQSNELSLRLFSTSMDRNMVVWAPDPMDGIWSPTIRIGDIGGNLGGSVGGNLLGFVGGCTMTTTQGGRESGEPNQIENILGIGFGGSFHLWERVMKTVDSDLWRPQTFLTGHFGAVTDVIWSNCPDDTSSLTNNEFILTVSVDQTCRLFAPNVSGEDRQHLSWTELSRPQVRLLDKLLFFS